MRRAWNGRGTWPVRHIRGYDGNVACSVVLAVVGMVAGLAGCIDPQLTLCEDGLACASNEVCDEIHHDCISPEQLTACTGLPELAACTAGAIAGECFNHVCLQPGCGNYVVEVGEQCDDGNHVDGDGCSQDCKSNEQCGNGVVDDIRGEQCDDGNLASHDGCDSQCRTETATWRAIPMSITQYTPIHAVFDDARGVLVDASGTLTWEWDGQAWHIPSLAPVPLAWEAIVYDSDLARITGIGKDTTGKRMLARWDGTTWQLSALNNTGPITIDTAVYVAAKKEIITLDGAEMYGLDVASSTWSNGIAVGFTAAPGATASVYDAARKKAVVLIDQSLATYEFDGSGWSTTTEAPPTSIQNWSLAYDGALGQVVAVGGDSGGYNYVGGIYAWDGAKWTDTGASVSARAYATVWYDASTASLGVSGGMNATSTLHDILRIVGVTTTDITPVQPLYAPPFYDSVNHRLVMLGLSSASWDGSAWHDLAGTPPSGVFPLAYDPVRGGVVGLGTTATWLYTNSWATIPGAPPTGLLARDVTYDYANRQLVGVAPSSTIALASNATSWTTIAPPVASPIGVAFDRAAQHVVALGGTAASLFDLDGNAWDAALSPGPGYDLVGALARGSIVMPPTSVAASRTVWERRGAAYASLGPLPIAPEPIAGVVDAMRGQEVIIINETTRSYLLVLQFTSGLPDETCAPGEDADGDGLAGCANPDCWEYCNPACPYAATCP